MHGLQVPLSPNGISFFPTPCIQSFHPVQQDHVAILFVYLSGVSWVPTLCPAHMRHHQDNQGGQAWDLPVGQRQEQAWRRVLLRWGGVGSLRGGAA